jgi:hypothetical protein
MRVRDPNGALKYRWRAWRDWRAEDPEYRAFMRSIGRGFWKRGY